MVVIYFLKNGCNVHETIYLNFLNERQGLRPIVGLIYMAIHTVKIQNVLKIFFSPTVLEDKLNA